MALFPLKEKIPVLSINFFPLASNEASSNRNQAFTKISMSHFGFWMLRSNEAYKPFMPLLIVFKECRAVKHLMLCIQMSSLDNIPAISRRRMKSEELRTSNESTCDDESSRWLLSCKKLFSATDLHGMHEICEVRMHMHRGGSWNSLERKWNSLEETFEKFVILGRDVPLTMEMKLSKQSKNYLIAYYNYRTEESAEILIKKKQIKTLRERPTWSYCTGEWPNFLQPFGASFPSWGRSCCQRASWPVCCRKVERRKWFDHEGSCWLKSCCWRWRCCCWRWCCCWI